MMYDIVLRYPYIETTEMYIATGIHAPGLKEAIKSARREARLASGNEFKERDFEFLLALPGKTEIFARGDLFY